MPLLLNKRLNCSQELSLLLPSLLGSATLEITETFKIHSNINDIPGYHPLQFNTRTGSSSGRGGVGMYIKDHLNFKHRPDISVFIAHIFESIFIEIQSKYTNVIIGTIYRPNTPPKADLDIFQNTLSELMYTIKHEKKNAVIMGDFNVDLLFAEFAVRFSRGVFFIRGLDPHDGSMSDTG